MKDSYRRNGPGANSGANAGWTQLLSQIILMPVSVFVYGLDLLMKMAGQIQDVTVESMSQTGGVGQVFVGTPFGEGGPASGNEVQNPRSSGMYPGTTQPVTRKEEKKMSDQTWSSGDEGWTMSEACKDKDPCDRLRLVRYKVLFLKDKLEVAFQEDEELVSEDITKDGFISWKVAEFIQRLRRREVKQPRKWFEKNNYPAHEGGSIEGKYPDSFITDLPDKDKRYLRVYSDVLAWYDRERKNYERDKVDALEEIRDELKGINLRRDYAQESDIRTGKKVGG